MGYGDLRAVAGVLALVLPMALAVGFKAAGGCCVGVAAAFLGAVLMAKP